MSHCDGPPACCPTQINDHPDAQQHVAVGVVLGGIYNVSEKASTYDADYYLYERWKPTPNFQPQTEIVNEVSRHSEQFDETELRGDSCIRARRIYSTLHNDFDLRRFPFDHQTLQLVLSDADYASPALAYDDVPQGVAISRTGRAALSSWTIEGPLTYAHHRQGFEGEPDSPEYDYATFSFQIRRHITHHVVKFFVPLLVVVALAFLVFWITPEDLSSQVNVGVTCVLSAIAFQFVQASNLPEVAYTTLNDRVYVVCYIAIALALALSVYTNALARNGRRERAISVARMARWAFPAATIVAILCVAFRSAREQRSGYNAVPTVTRCCARWTLAALRWRLWGMST